MSPEGRSKSTMSWEGCNKDTMSGRGCNKDTMSRGGCKRIPRASRILRGTKPSWKGPNEGITRLELPSEDWSRDLSTHRRFIP
ncbi:hypothetical protein N7455_002068 [Penicillium solitum]|uniref:uncharacterized protein n=1 Tax=Penicillium solitum TaxID=60172 RepID=UPI0032C42657|nr:hypothetical protein N7455_002068 [Penicillium solitum]